MTHYAIAWLYIQGKEYDKAQEHINILPTVSSNTLRESISSQLTLFQKGPAAWEKAAELFKEMREKIFAYVDFAQASLEKESVLEEFGEKATANMRNYTSEYAKSKIDFNLTQLKGWVEPDLWAKFEKLI